MSDLLAGDPLAGLWLGRVLVAMAATMNIDLGVGTPFVELGCTFHSPITPRCDLSMEVTVNRIGRSSLGFQVNGFQGSPERCFSGEFVCVFIDAIRVKSIPIPARMRANIRRFAERQESPFEDSTD